MTEAVCGGWWGGDKIGAKEKEVLLVFLLLGDSPASEFYMPTFRNTLFHLHRRCKQEE